MPTTPRAKFHRFLWWVCALYLALWALLYYHAGPPGCGSVNRVEICSRLQMPWEFGGEDFSIFVGFPAIVFLLLAGFTLMMRPSKR
ncbi:hypothetical protein K1T73_11245 [Roseovarius sp. SCSIO 43702]|uniref:hypothetical protein n=1 Tax=Roseovarius sp. SCSIO 43702 TaxID=2823043 RepID=UPI001C73A4AA|nr:hypothetical protein [Roseovarius sp. SCSIO 43702]QYX55663.1 hypothetical protein K1T73_11245 [Roseovarius sp. SCSIO 43702]